MGLKLLFIAIMIMIALIDYHAHKIPNAIILPAIMFFLYATGNYIPALIMFLIGYFLFIKDVWGGGDVKLCALLGAYLGWWSIAVFVILLGALDFISRYYRSVEKNPCAPVALLSCIPFLFFV